MRAFIKPGKQQLTSWRGYITGIASVALVTWLKYLAQPNIIPPEAPILYIAAIVPIAIIYGLGPSLLVCLLSVLAFDYFFVSPLHTLSIFKDISGSFFIIIFFGVSIAVSLLAANLRRKNEEIEQLTAKIISSQEEEKKSLARELHDDISPTLATLGLSLDGTIAKNPDLPEDVKENISEVRGKLNSVQQNIRSFSHELHPTVLDNLGLEPALEELAAEMNAKRDMKIQTNISGTERQLANDVKLTLYRIAQESLNNVYKHSKVTEATLNLKYDEREVELSVIDNGVGFNKAIRNKQGLGLTSMQERANLIGANLKIESEQGKGTKVILKAKI